MKDLATHIIARAQLNGSKITNLNLHRVLYFTLLEALEKGIMTEKELEKIYDWPFYVWRYGPTVEYLYNVYSVYGASNIFSPEEENEEYGHLNEIIDSLLKEDLFDLVRASHTHSHWVKHQESIQKGKGNVEYTIENLVHYQ